MQNAINEHTITWKAIPQEVFCNVCEWGPLAITNPPGPRGGYHLVGDPCDLRICSVTGRETCPFKMAKQSGDDFYLSVEAVTAGEFKQIASALQLWRIEEAA